MKNPVGRASSPAAFGGTGFQPVHPHRQDAGATKNFSGQGKNMSSIKVERRPSPERLQELGVAQAFQPVLAQAKVCGYKNNPLIATRYYTKLPS